MIAYRPSELFERAGTPYYGSHYVDHVTVEISGNEKRVFSLFSMPWLHIEDDVGLPSLRGFPDFEIVKRYGLDVGAEFVLFP